jgi:hypothetical protein
LSPVSRQLESRVGSVREHLVRRAGLAAAAWVGGGTGLLLIVAWALSGSDGWRQGSNVPAVLDLLALFGIVASLVYFRAVVRRRFDEVPLSAAIEESVGIRPGVLRGSLELARSTPAGMSSVLADHAVRGAVRDLDGRAEADLAGALGAAVARWSRRGMGVAVVLAFALVVLTVAAPERTARALAGVTSPISTAANPILPPLVVLPGSVEVQRGTDVTLDISAAGRREIEVAWQAAGDVARSERVTVDEGRAGYVFRTVSAAIDYRVEDADGNTSATYRIEPVDPLFVSDLVLTVSYPPHTGLPADEYRGDPPPLRVPDGSTLRFEGLTSRPLSSVSLLDSVGVSVLDFEIEGTTFRARWTPGADGMLDWDFRDELGAPAEIQPEPLEVTVVADRAPVVAIPMPGRDTIMPLNLRQPLVIEAGDDYGLRRLDLVAYRVTSFGERMDPVIQGFDIGGQRAILARPLLDLARWGLLPGDTVRYFARVTDNSPTAQVTTTPEYVLRLPEAAELRREAEEALEGVAEKLADLAAEAERQAEENRDKALEAATERSDSEGTQEEAAADFEQREELQAALEEQMQMSAEVDSMRSEMEMLEKMMEEAGQADPELRAQLEQLQDLLSQMTGDELQERMDDLSSALEQDDMEQATQSLEEMAAQQEEFRQRLEEAIEQFQRAALEQDFRATTTEAEELARQEQALADAMSEDDAPELRAQQQEELAQQAEQLEESMEGLQERLADMGETEASDGVRQAQQSATEARQQMEQAQEQAERGESQDAGEQAQEAADRMEQAAQEMQEAMQEMAEQEMEAQQAALRQTADDALSLARRQSELREQMRGASQEQLARMRAEEASLLQGVQNIAENLQIATEGAMGDNREMSAQMGLTMESLQNTIDAMESRRGTTSPSAQAEQVIGDLNGLALMAIAGAEQMGQQGQGQGGEDVAEQLEQLAQQQGELTNQSTELMPMQLGEQAMSQQLQEMQQGQQSVASDLGDLADEPGSEEALGDLQQLAQEAQVLAEQMAQGRLTPEIVQQQERLFHRLLDAGRSLEREEFSEERESEEPGDFERGDVSSLTAEQMGVLPYQLPDRDQFQALSPAVKQLVLEYFERLNRGRSGGGGP